jgi:hypothetical protein
MRVVKRTLIGVVLDVPIGGRLPWIHRSSGTSVADLKESIALASAAGRLRMQPDDLPSGNLLHSYRKSQFLIGKPSTNGPFSIAMLVYQRVGV